MYLVQYKNNSYCVNINIRLKMKIFHGDIAVSNAFKKHKAQLYTKQTKQTLRLFTKKKQTVKISLHINIIVYTFI